MCVILSIPEGRLTHFVSFGANWTNRSQVTFQTLGTQNTQFITYHIYVFFLVIENVRIVQ